MIHPRSSSLDHPACTGLAARGFHTLCENGRYLRFSSKADDIIWDDLALDIKAGVEFMRKQPGVHKMVLIAYSGGGPLMSYYQALAENGVRFCQDPQRIFPCSNDPANMPAADGMVMLESHIGYSSDALFQHHQMAVKDDQFRRLTPDALDPSLDVFSPANGYDPKAPTYTDDFLKPFFAGQAAREERLVKIAQDRWAAIQAGKSTYKDDERHYGELARHPCAAPVHRRHRLVLDGAERAGVQRHGRQRQGAGGRRWHAAQLGALHRLRQNAGPVCRCA
jgi:hypothetical protein